jgi:hypothetical protein
MTVSSIPMLPSKALPLREAMGTFLPKELLAEHSRAIETLQKKKRPPRPDYLSMSVREWQEAIEWYQVATRPAREAEADLYRIWAQMMRAVVEQLIEGSLIALVQADPPFGAWRRIPAAAWRTFKIKDVRHGRVTGPGIDLTGLHVMPAPLQEADYSQTGLSGRPAKSRHIIEAEFERRAKAGDLDASLSKFSKALLVWFLEEHPDKPAPTARVIENNLRHAYREARNRKTSNPTKK